MASGESPEGAPECTRRVLIAVDASPQSEETFSWYFETLHKPDVKVILAHCPEQPNFPYYTFDTGMAISGADWERVVNEHKESTDELVRHFKKRLEDLKVNYDIIIKQQIAGAGDAICQVADEQQVDHIVIGSRGMGAIRRTILGSVSDYVLHHAKVPVTVHLRRH